MRRGVRWLTGGVSAAVLVAGILLGTPSAAMADSSSVAIGDYPHGVVVSPDGTRVYAAAAVPGGQPGRLVAVDTATDAIIGEVEVGVEPFGVVVSPDGATLYVANVDSGTITVVDTATLTATGTLAAPGGPFALAIDPTGSTLYASMRFGSRVDAFDTALGTVVTSYPTGGLPAGLALDATNGFLYVAESGGNTARRITLADASSIALSAYPSAAPYFLGLNPASGELWVSPYIGDDVAVIDTATFTVDALIPIAGNARGIVFTADGRALVNMSDQSAVAVVDVATRSVIGTTPVGSGPEAIAIASDGMHAWIGNLFGASITLVGPPLPARPADATVVDGSEVTFSAAVRATVDAMQWQSSTDGGATWTDIPGATTNTLTFTAPLASNGTLYRILASSVLFGEAASEPALLTVTALPAPPAPPVPPAPAPAPAIAATGFDAAAPVGIALALALAGGILMRVRRPAR